MIASGIDSTELPIPLSKLTSPEQAQQEINPNSSTRFVKIGDAMALIHEGIPILGKLKERIFGKKEVPNTPSFDFVDLSTDEVSVFSAENIDRSRHGYQHLQNEGTIEDPSSPYFHMTEQEYQKDFQRRGENYQDARAIDATSHLLNEHTQDAAVDSYFAKVFEQGDQMEQNFLDDVRKNPDKPFLIVYGHGSEKTRSRLFGLIKKSFWSISEGSGEHATDLKEVLKYMDAGKYSAILLVSCNKNEILPPKVGKAKIYFVEGLAGMRDLNTRRTARSI